VTLVTESGRWIGIAAVDRDLLQAPVFDSFANPARLIVLGGPRTRAVSFLGRGKPAVALVDRDGTIMVDREYLADPDGVTLLPGAAAGLALFASHGVGLVVLTNQSGVGSGRITPSQLAQVHARLREVLAAEGVALEGIYSCIHATDAGCDCRKPATGLARQAAADLGLALDGAVVAGDKPADVTLARRLGVPAFLVTTGCGESTLVDPAIQADYVVDGLDDMARICLHPAGLATVAPPPND
jgi:D-glycero-D-manno-heptose 1,7-bisphosphate phosphatase